MGSCWASPFQSPSPWQGSIPGSSGEDIGGSPGPTATSSKELVVGDNGTSSGDAPHYSTRHPNPSEGGTLSPPSPPSGNSAKPVEAPGEETPMTPPEPSEEDENMSSDGSYLSSQLV